MTMSDLVVRVADHMYRDALCQGLASIDIGLFGAKLFHAEAAALVARGEGKSWVVDKARLMLAPMAALAGDSSDQSDCKLGVES